MFGGDSEEVTPVPIPNTEVKLFSADGSWGFPPVRVGRRQANVRPALMAGLFCVLTTRTYEAKHFMNVHVVGLKGLSRYYRGFAFQFCCCIYWNEYFPLARADFRGVLDN